jgi:hypothetical protein
VRQNIVIEAVAAQRRGDAGDETVSLKKIDVNLCSGGSASMVRNSIVINNAVEILSERGDASRSDIDHVDGDGTNGGWLQIDTNNNAAAIQRMGLWAGTLALSWE